MSDRVKLGSRLAGALILASVGATLGLLLGNPLHVNPVWYVPMGIGLGAGAGAGFFLIWLGRLERYRD